MLLKAPSGLFPFAVSDFPGDLEPLAPGFPTAYPGEVSFPPAPEGSCDLVRGFGLSLPPVVSLMPTVPMPEGKTPLGAPQPFSKNLFFFSFALASVSRLSPASLESPGSCPSPPSGPALIRAGPEVFPARRPPPPSARGFPPPPRLFETPLICPFRQLPFLPAV